MFLSNLIRLSCPFFCNTDLADDIDHEACSILPLERGKA